VSQKSLCRYTTNNKTGSFVTFNILLQAYDNVKRDMLWKMVGEKSPSSLLKIIKCIYRNTKGGIRFNYDTVSEPVQTYTGVRQGFGLFPVYLMCILIKFYNTSKW
jgi:hypothetical protein